MAMDSSPFPAGNGSGTSFLILSVSIVGILAISLLLLAYYLLLTRCHNCSGDGLFFLLFFCGCPAGLDNDDVRRQPHHHPGPPVPPRRSGGLEEAAIRRIPTFRYHRHGDDGGHGNAPTAAAARSSEAITKLGGSNEECAVCLADFRDGDRLRLLPPCLHAFHIDCIDAWLQAIATCPLCRAPVVASSDSPYCHYALHNANHRHLATNDDDVAIDIPSSSSAADEEEAAEQRPAAAAAHAPTTSSAFSQFQFQFQPMRRRSLSMDSSTDKRFYLALQRTLQLQQHNSSGYDDDDPDAGKGGSSINAAAADANGGQRSRRLRRSFFSFSLQSRPSPSAVLPL